MSAFLLVFIGLTVPSAIFYIAPFESEISSKYLSVIVNCNLLALGGTFLYPFFRGVCSKKQYGYSSTRIRSRLLVLLVIVAALNLYIYAGVGFRLAVTDISVRADVYEVAGSGWFLLVALLMTSALLLGYAHASGVKLPMVIKLLIIFNFLCIIGYGMKSNALQMLVCYIAGKGGLSVDNMSARKLPNILKPVGYVVILLLAFWLINSLRAGEMYSVASFFIMLYLYVVPPFANFGNLIDQSFVGSYPLGGMLEGVYKIFFIKTNPLSQTSVEDFIHPTWNVWSAFANFYLSGGLFELYLSFVLVGVYCALTFALWVRNNSLMVRMNMAQCVILCLTLHNSYYYQSASPLIAILLCGVIVKSHRLSSRLRVS